MALGFTRVATLADGTDATSYAFASRTPAAGVLHIIDVEHRAAVTADQPTLSGCGITWVAEATVDHSAALGFRLTRFRGMAASPTTGQVTIAFANTQQACVASWEEVTGTDTSGADGAGAFVQTATNGSTTLVSSLTVTLAAFADAVNNAVFVAFDRGGASPPDISLEAAYTSHASVTVESNRLRTGYFVGQDTSVVGTMDTSTARCRGIASEIKMAAGTNYNQSISGGLTPSAVLAIQTNKALAGSLTPAATLLRLTAKLLAGALTPAATLATVKAALVSLVGAITPSGSLTKQTGKVLAGALVPLGDLVRRTAKALAGALTPSGTLASIRTVLVSLAGGLVPAGTLVKRTGKALAGALTPTGALSRLTSKVLAGVLVPIGALVASITGTVIAYALRFFNRSASRYRVTDCSAVRYRLTNYSAARYRVTNRSGPNGYRYS